MTLANMTLDLYFTYATTVAFAVCLVFYIVLWAVAPLENTEVLVPFYQIGAIAGIAGILWPVTVVVLNTVIFAIFIEAFAYLAKIIFKTVRYD